MTNPNEKSELAWMAEARKHIGVKEVPGKDNNPTIIGWLKILKAAWSDDSTPWCASFAAISLLRANRFVPKEKFRALAYLDAGIRLSRPAYGCIVVFKRDGGGHVGFVAGKDKSGNLMVLGGNQNDMVCISPFKFDRVVGYVWPALSNGQQTTPNEFRYDLPILNSLGISTSVSVT
ncbi:MAG: TIGR02594 family protein [Chryseobacterium sp.]|nr:MAG: TIGR02594 family protein [Chryseobacterium sp.]